MEKREDLETILPYLPLMTQDSSLSWPSPHLVEVLQAMTKGPGHSQVDSGQTLSDSISDMRRALSPTSLLSSSALQGYALFFDERMSKEESSKWFNEVLPAMACLLLRFPTLLELHYQNSENLINGTKTGLRVLGPKKAGIVFLSQELIGAILSCSFFCLFPVENRGSNHLPNINFDKLFGSLVDNKGRNEHQENKIKCIIHYFHRLSSFIPPGFVSFERKVLSLEQDSSGLEACPDESFWSRSTVKLCPVEIHTCGLIEDQSNEALEVDFANKYLGGGVLRKGCVQEEIRFMINPELISGMLFLPSMEVDEAIEVVGAERFSHYTGYSSSFQFAGDYKDTKEIDVYGRRKTRIIAIDALRHPGISQYKPESLIRETNKALCGFLHGKCIDDEDGVGVATGNWGCGAYGGDPELKSLLQWLAVSQARRPLMSYYTFGFEALDNFNQVTELVISKGWTVGDLWKKLIKYSNQRLKSKKKRGDPKLFLFDWLISIISS